MAAAVAVAVPALVAAPAAAQAEPTPEVTPAQIVILVDESGSISPPDLVREKEAAGLIAQSEFSPRSRVAVVGFGSDEGGVGPTDAVCPPVVVAGAAERQRLSDCVDGLRKREQGRGDDTDHAAALEQALNYVDGDAPGPKMIFLLTDGVLDVGDTVRYGTGKSLGQRNDAARQLVTTLLERARSQRVQVWPLGFGQVDQAALDQFAAGAFQGECGPQAPTPTATVVATSADVDRAILDAYGAGRCAGIGEIRKEPLPTGATTEVPVDIPSIATDGSITVIKRDPRIGVEYLAPGATTPVPKAGTADGSTFEVSGENGPVEALRIVNPEPGTWRVRISSPPEVPPVDVTTAVTWQGAVQALLTPAASSVAAGQPLTVSLKLVTKRGPVVDPVQLSGLSFTATLTGTGGPDVPIPLADQGAAPDTVAGDGVYSGAVTLPTGARDTVVVQGSVRGIGISGDDPRATVQVITGPPPVLVSATLPNINDVVYAGEGSTGQLSVANNSGQPRRLRLIVVPDSGADVTLADEAVREVAPGSTTVPVRFMVGADRMPGVVGGTLQVVDDADPATVYGSFPFTLRVELPWWERYFAYLVGGAVALVALLAVLAFLYRRRTTDLGQLRVTVTAGAASADRTVTGGREFRFQVTRSDEGQPALQQIFDDRPGAFRLTRTGSALRLRIPDGRVLDLTFDSPKDVGDGMSVAVTTRTRQSDESRESREPRRTEPVDSDL